MLIGGDAGHALGDSLYEAVIYVAGKVASLEVVSPVTYAFPFESIAIPTPPSVLEPPMKPA